MADTGKFFNISDFMSSIRTRGVLKTNRYEMSIGNIGKGTSWLSKKLGVTGINTDAGKLVSLRCDSVQLPGMSFATVDGFMRFGYGTGEAIPYSPVFDQFNATFIVDANSTVHKFFYQWVNYIVNFDSKGQTQLSTKNTVSARPYELAFRDDYVSDITINVFDEATEKWTMSFTAYNAFPKGFPPVDLSYASNDELFKITIPFGFTDFNVNYNYLPGREAVVASPETSTPTALETLRNQ